MLTLYFLFRDFPYHDFSARDVEQLVSSMTESRYAETPTHAWLNFNASSLHRYFGLCGIMNPDEIVSGLLATKTRNGVPPVHSPTPVAPHYSFGYWDITFRDFVMLVARLMGLLLHGILDFTIPVMPIDVFLLGNLPNA
jgi:hypothetical protein